MPPDAVAGASNELACRELNELRRYQLQVLRNLRFFRLTNRLERLPRDESSTVMHYALVLVIVLVESGANAYFFAQGNDRGYLGGMLQALLISVVNVGTAVAVGKFWLPLKNHVLPSNRRLGLAAIPVYFLFAIVFNLLAAHYRDAISLSPEQAMSLPVDSLLARPFHLTFESFMLFTAGLVAGALGLWKGYTEDDPYPGYGELSRKYRAARRAFVDMRRRYPDCEYESPEEGDDS